MAEAAAQTTGQGQTTGQSSSNSGSQQSSQATGAQSGASGQQAQATQQTDSGQQQTAAAALTPPARPAYVPESFWDASKGTVTDEAKFAQHVNDLSAFKAEQDVRTQSLPASADKYEIKLPDGFKPPEGMAFEFDMNDPGLAEARKAALDMKLDQPSFQRLLGIYAANKIQELQGTTVARNAELAKLGSTAPQRMDAIETWFKAKVGDKAGPMMAALKAYPVAQTVEALEGVIQAFVGQGGTNFNQSHREGAPEAGKIQGFETMSFEQRRIAQMNQKAASGGR